MSDKALYIQTPLLESITISDACGIPVYLKMENVQPSGSFKIRGISNYVKKSICNNNKVKRLVTASGGNAGMATAYTGKVLQIPTIVVIPETVPRIMVSKLVDEKADVQVTGQVWNDSQDAALEIAKDEASLYVRPFDHPFVWEGIESMVDEIIDQCPLLLSAIVLSVGGGGLLCGILQGLIKKGLKIPVIAVETEGANCLKAALEAGKPVNIGQINSIAKTLGALSITPRVFDLLPDSNLISELVSDKEAVNACLQFADDHRVLVEPSCGAALSAGYSGIVSRLVKEGKINPKGAVVFVVCGGNGVTLKLLQGWKERFGIADPLIK